MTIHRWGRYSMSVIIDAEPATPVAHSPHGDALHTDGLYTACGKKWSRFTDSGSQTLMGALWIRTRHAKKFCQPCKRCFPEVTS